MKVIKTRIKGFMVGKNYGPNYKAVAASGNFLPK